ncbi:MAG: GrpB-like predicted nucleotidyltransferase (UPF0157 family) [Flavobacteriaceae bacterium]|jgi:GrpB-like predicted nucleotidyltransferase (UPF0157 family)
MKKHRLYKLETYSKKWSGQFLELKNQVISILDDNIITIQHIGSTSVPGMIAKPQIDILVVVKDLNKIPYSYKEFESKDFTIHGRGYVTEDDEYITLDNKLTGSRIASLHIMEKNHPDVFQTILLRDHLRHCKKDRELYINKKKSLYKDYCNDYSGYDTGKSETVEKIIENANECRVCMDSKVLQ